MLKNFDLVVDRSLVPLSDMIKITGPIGLGAFLIMETKERAVLLLKIFWKAITKIGVPSLQHTRPALVKSLVPAAGLSFCFLPMHSQAGVPVGKASGLTFKVAILTSGAITFAA